MLTSARHDRGGWGSIHWSEQVRVCPRPESHPRLVDAPSTVTRTDSAVEPVSLSMATALKHDSGQASRHGRFSLEPGHAGFRFRSFEARASRHVSRGDARVPPRSYRHDELMCRRRDMALAMSWSFRWTMRPHPIWPAGRHYVSCETCLLIAPERGRLFGMLHCPWDYVTLANPASPCANFSQRNRCLRWRVLAANERDSISRWQMR